MERGQATKREGKVTDNLESYLRTSLLRIILLATYNVNLFAKGYKFNSLHSF